MFPRFPLQVSTDPRQAPLDFLHVVHQTPVRIPPSSPQVNSRKEFNEHEWEVCLEYDAVHCIPKLTGYLANESGPVPLVLDDKGTLPTGHTNGKI